jgi:hypothetical protein
MIIGDLFCTTLAEICVTRERGSPGSQQGFLIPPQYNRSEIQKRVEATKLRHNNAP